MTAKQFSVLAPARFVLTREDNGGYWYGTVEYQHTAAADLYRLEILPGEHRGKFTPVLLRDFCAAVLDQLGHFNSLGRTECKKHAAALASAPLVTDGFPTDWGKQFFFLNESEVRAWADREVRQ